MTQLKLLTIGDSGVGKTWLLLRWAGAAGKLSTYSSSMPTIGIDFKMKTTVIKGKRIKVQVVSAAPDDMIKKCSLTAFHSPTLFHSPTPLQFIVPILAVGHSGTRAIPHDHYILLPSLPRHSACLRRHRPDHLRQYPDVDVPNPGARRPRRLHHPDWQ
jgi:hypothetical protein